MPRVRKPTGKAVVQEAVSVAGRALAAVIKALEDNAAQVSNQEFETAFAFMRQTIQVLEAQARKDRLLKNAGAFSFDDPSHDLLTYGDIDFSRASPPPSERYMYSPPTQPAAEPPPAPAPLSPPPEPTTPPAPVLKRLPRGETPPGEIAANRAGTPIRAFTGRVSRYSGDAAKLATEEVIKRFGPDSPQASQARAAEAEAMKLAGEPVTIKLQTEPLKGIADMEAEISFLDDKENA